MRAMGLLLAVAGLVGCQDQAAQKPVAEATPAALTFDGAGASEPAAVLKHGERLSHVLGCRGCHTKTLEGMWFNKDAPHLGKLYATNLTRALPHYDDAALETLLRDGTHPTRGDMWIMPSEVFQRLSDADMKALIAHLRTVPPSGAPTPPPALSAAAKAEIASGKMKPAAAYVAEYKTKVPVELGERHALGRYVAATTCAECHGGDLTGVPDFIPGTDVPDLDVVGPYSEAELERLLTTGEGKTKKDLGLMTIVAKGHFAYLTPRERSALIAYLKARAARAK